MRCPFCDAADTRVIDSRLGNEGDSVRRRRECATCSERFSTFETAELSLPRIVKCDGRREPFDDEKLRSGIMKALEKRPVDTERVEETISRLKHRLHVRGEREILSRDFGEWVMEELRELDQVAYVRFASVYRSFQDVQAFRAEIDRLESEPPRNLTKQQLSLLAGGKLQNS
ncbi:MAG: transcriptional regulator NrdR [Gammaproteobacteria bacterium]|nr:MAG: transcriptional regulator NrdR [Gammaproteobacteria bacterium]TND07352.1 MAG: transcriptional regulator NrdR [Gammaproteobacteria bacterium]